MTPSLQVPTTFYHVSILQKYDYDDNGQTFTVEYCTFQFYRSTIMTSYTELRRYMEKVSILQKYDYDYNLLTLGVGIIKFQFYRSTIMTIVAEEGLEPSTSVSILQKYDYDHHAKR